MQNLKNMKLGNKFSLICCFLIFNSFLAYAEDPIVTSPLINLNEIKPSFEELEESNNLNSTIKIKDKKKVIQTNKNQGAILIGLDKITAKTSEIPINLGESKKFGLLEIKVLKCGKVRSQNKNDNVAYLQVKDLSKTQDDKVFIFNGWTFSSDPSLTPFDHAIYDIQLINCTNV